MARPTPSFVSEADLNERFNTSKLLASKGDYGCGAVVFQGDLEDEPGSLLFDDHWFYALNTQHPDDVGTVLVTGNVRSKSELFVSDRLMCLVVLGSFEAPALSVFETEMYVGGDLTVGDLTDRDNYLTVKGTRSVAETAKGKE